MPPVPGFRGQCPLLPGKMETICQKQLGSDETWKSEHSDLQFNFLRGETG